jgi:hypothetical protein
MLEREDNEAQRAAVENRIAQLTSLANTGGGGWTDRKRRALNRERNVLQAWLSPKTPDQRRDDRLQRIREKRDAKQQAANGEETEASERRLKSVKRRIRRRAKAFKSRCEMMRSENRYISRREMIQRSLVIAPGG